MFQAASATTSAPSVEPFAGPYVPSDKDANECNTIQYHPGSSFKQDFTKFLRGCPCETVFVRGLYQIGKDDKVQQITSALFGFESVLFSIRNESPQILPKEMYAVSPKPRQVLTTASFGHVIAPQGAWAHREQDRVELVYVFGARAELLSGGRYSFFKGGCAMFESNFGYRQFGANGVTPSMVLPSDILAYLPVEVHDKPMHSSEAIIQGQFKGIAAMALPRNTSAEVIAENKKRIIDIYEFAGESNNKLIKKTGRKLSLDEKAFNLLSAKNPYTMAYGMLLRYIYGEEGFDKQIDSCLENGMMILETASYAGRDEIKLEADKHWGTFASVQFTAIGPIKEDGKDVKFKAAFEEGVFLFMKLLAHVKNVYFPFGDASKYDSLLQGVTTMADAVPILARAAAILPQDA